MPAQFRLIPLFFLLGITWALLSGCTHPDEPNPVVFWRHRQFFQGMELVAEGSYEKAIAKLDSYLHRYPSDDASHFFRGQAKYHT